MFFSQQSQPARSRPSASLSLETLEKREVPATLVSMNRLAQTLTITGNDANETVKLSLTNGGRALTVLVQERGSDDIVDTQKTYSFATSRLRTIVYNANGGDDVFINQTNIGSVARGGTGNDLLIGGSGANVLYGDAGNDELRGGRAVDFLFGGHGNDTIHGGPSIDTIYGESGNDTLHGDTGDDRIYGGAGNDTIFGNAGNDFLLGESGNDMLHGDDLVFASFGGGHDLLDGGDGVDVLTGYSGNDTLRGGNGNDVLLGGFGNDRLYGDNGADTLYGEAGNDYLNGGRDGALDHLVGGAGADNFEDNKSWWPFDVGEYDVWVDMNRGEGDRAV